MRAQHDRQRGRGRGGTIGGVTEFGDAVVEQGVEARVFFTHGSSSRLFLNTQGLILIEIMAQATSA